MVHVVMLLYPKLTQLDLTGPYEVLARLPGVTIDLAWKSVDVVEDAHGLKLTPTVSYENCPQADVLFVPGGPGQLALMRDGETIAFLQRQARGARWITSVCTGSLLLAAAGLLTGYRATSHWLSIDQLTQFGCEPISERVVIDRDRITGAGVTSGIDFALTLGAEIFDPVNAQRVQLALEYDPHPPFAAGSPFEAPPSIIEAVRLSSEPFQRLRENESLLAAAQLQGTGQPYRDP